MDNIKQELVETKFAIGAVVKHRFLDFRGVIFDVDPEFNNTEEWYQSIPASIRPRKNQPFYHLLRALDNQDLQLQILSRVVQHQLGDPIL